MAKLSSVSKILVLLYQGIMIKILSKLKRNVNVDIPSEQTAAC